MVEHSQLIIGACRENEEFIREFKWRHNDRDLSPYECPTQNPETRSNSATQPSMVKQELPTPNTGPSIEEAKKECSELGFKAGTEKFGECVLQLTE